MSVSSVGPNLGMQAAQMPSAAASSVGMHNAPVSAHSGQGSNGVARTGEVVRKGQLQDAVNTVNKFIEPTTSNLEFQIDDQTGRTIMKLIDKETGSVLRQLPSEEMLAIARALDKLSGLVIKLKA